MAHPKIFAGESCALPLSFEKRKRNTGMIIIKETNWNNTYSRLKIKLAKINRLWLPAYFKNWSTAFKS